MRRSKCSAAALLLCLCLLCGAAAGENLRPSTYDPSAAKPVCTLNLFVEGGEEDADRIRHLTLDPAGSLCFSWTAEGEADRFLAVLTGPSGEVGRQDSDELTWSVEEKDLTEGEYRLTVTAYLGGVQTGSASLRLILESAVTEDPVTDPGTGGGGGRPGRPSGGGRRPGGSSGGGTTVRPGQALTTAHARGTGDLIPYDAVALILPDEPSDTLVLGGVALDVTGGGFPVCGELDGDVLTLTAPGGDGAWRVNLGALDTLYRSGLRTLRLVGGEETLEIDTAWEPAGTAYARERAKGLVAEDFALVWDGESLVLTVEDRVYPVETEPIAKGEGAP
ncbi:MAG: hypothetical protein IJK28_04855 [Clostridia bacterium]|nr:hypothetical protein [Clostridia bacterium]